MSGKLLASYVFGSAARGDADQLSDLDILAIVEDGGGKVPDEDVLVRVPPEYKHLQPSISWYGQKRLREIFRNGDLFAWHLHLETIVLVDDCHILSSLGVPAPYREAMGDIASFVSIMSKIPEELNRVRRNSIYEAGLTYVCLRNIGMAASSRLASRPDFSRYSPMNLSNMEPCPIQKCEYDLLMKCRMSGRRDIPVDQDIASEWVIDLHSKVAPWIETIIERIK